MALVKLFSEQFYPMHHCWFLLGMYECLKQEADTELSRKKMVGIRIRGKSARHVIKHLPHEATTNQTLQLPDILSQNNFF